MRFSFGGRPFAVEVVTCFIFDLKFWTRRNLIPVIVFFSLPNIFFLNEVEAVCAWTLTFVPCTHANCFPRLHMHLMWFSAEFHSHCHDTLTVIELETSASSWQSAGRTQQCFMFKQPIIAFQCPLNGFSFVPVFHRNLIRFADQSWAFLLLKVA